MLRALLPSLAVAGAAPAMRSAHSPLQPDIAATELTTPSNASRLHLSQGGTLEHVQDFLASGEAATPQACLEDFPAIYRKECMSQFDMSQQREIEALLGACDWTTESTATNLNVSWGPNNVADIGSSGDNLSTARTYMSEDSYTIGRCLGPRGGDQWEFLRVGPMTTTGGKDWTSFRSCDGVMIPADAPCKQFSGLDAHLDLFPGFGKHFEWPKGAEKRVLAVSEYVNVAMDESGRLLGYPPLHQHHFHVEHDAYNEPVEEFTAAMITHGDDQCVQSAGGVNCAIQRSPWGYATKVTLPLYLSADVNDVRAEGSAPLSWYLLIAIKGRPDDGQHKSWTQMRLRFKPTQARLGYFGSYLIPSNVTSVFWREGTFKVTAPVRWSYFHNHGTWGYEMLFYIGANSTQLRMNEINLVSTDLSERTDAEVEKVKSQLAAQASNVGAQLACHYQRTASQLEVYPNTAESACTLP